MISVPDYLDLRARLTGFDHFAVNWGNGMEQQGTCLIGQGAGAESVRCAGVSVIADAHPAPVRPAKAA